MKLIQDNKKLIIIGVSCLLIGRYILKQDPIVIEKEVIVYREKNQTISQSRRVVVINQENRPDGSSTTETTTTEESSNQSNTEIAVDRTTIKETPRVSKITLGVLALKDLGQFSKNTHIGVLTKAPLIGNLSIIGSIDTTKRVGIGLALEF